MSEDSATNNDTPGSPSQEWVVLAENKGDEEGNLPDKSHDVTAQGNGDGDSHNPAVEEPGIEEAATDEAGGTKQIDEASLLPIAQEDEPAPIIEEEETKQIEEANPPPSIPVADLEEVVHGNEEETKQQTLPAAEQQAPEADEGHAAAEQETAPIAEIEPLSSSPVAITSPVEEDKGAPQAEVVEPEQEEEQELPAATHEAYAVAAGEQVEAKAASPPHEEPSIALEPPHEEEPAVAVAHGELPLAVPQHQEDEPPPPPASQQQGESKNSEPAHHITQANDILPSTPQEDILPLPIITAAASHGKGDVIDDPLISVSSVNPGYQATAPTTPIIQEIQQQEKIDYSPPASPSGRKSRLNISIITSGSRGDVQPYLCLALALQNAGHNVVFGVEDRMRSFVESFGVKYARIAGDPTSVLFSKEGQQMLKDGKILKMMGEMKKLQEPTYEQCLQDYVNACENADVIVSGPLCLTQAYCIAEEKNIPWTCLALGPSVPTGDFPLFMVSQSNLFFRFLNKATYSLLFWSLWKSEEKQINRFRKETLDLKPMKGGSAEVIEKTNPIIIHAYPPFIIPGGKRPSDWTENHRLVGFIFPPNNITPLRPELEAFIAKNDEAGVPIYLGFGSMPAPDPKHMLRVAAQVVHALKVRAVIVAGWTEVTADLKKEVFGEENEQVLIVDTAPHEWLLPRCSVIVHHCGIGTTAAVLRSGVPSVPCPVYLDQPYWGHRLNELGVAAKPIPFQKLTGELLAQAVKQVLSTESMRTKAQELSKQVAENGVENAVEQVLNIATTPPKFVQW